MAMDGGTARILTMLSVLAVLVSVDVSPAFLRYFLIVMVSMRVILDIGQYLTPHESMKNRFEKVSKPNSSPRTYRAPESISVYSPSSSSSNARNAYNASRTPPHYGVNSPPATVPSKFATFTSTPIKAVPSVHHVSPYSDIQYRPSVREEGQPHYAEHDVDELALHDLALQELHDQRISLRAIEMHSQRIRCLIAQDILRPLCASLRQNDADLIELRKTLGKDASFAQSVVGTRLGSCDPSNAVEIAAYVREYLGSVPELQTLIVARNELDFFLNIPRCAEDTPTGFDASLTFPSEYVRERVEKLSRDSLMNDYHWDQGAPFKGKSWSSDIAPTDTQLLLHIFARWIDTQVQPRGSFSKSYITYRPSHIPAKKMMAPIMIEQVSVVPPYFTIRTKDPAGKVKISHPLPGRHVLFNTLALFIHHVNRYYNGQVCRSRLSLLAKSWSARAALQQIDDVDDDEDPESDVD